MLRAVGNSGLGGAPGHAADGGHELGMGAMYDITEEDVEESSGESRASGESPPELKLGNDDDHRGIELPPIRDPRPALESSSPHARPAYSHEVV